MMDEANIQRGNYAKNAKTQETGYVISSSADQVVLSLDSENAVLQIFPREDMYRILKSDIKVSAAIRRRQKEDERRYHQGVKTPDQKGRRKHFTFLNDAQSYVNKPTLFICAVFEGADLLEAKYFGGNGMYAWLNEMEKDWCTDTCITKMYSFGLSNDGWLPIYICNDKHDKSYLADCCDIGAHDKISAEQVFIKYTPENGFLVSTEGDACYSLGDDMEYKVTL